MSTKLPTKRKGGALSDKTIGEVLKKTKGNVSKAAIALKYDRGWINDRVLASPYLQEIREQAKESALDDAEEVLKSLITDDRELGAVCFFLKTIGKHRGYVEDKSNTTVILKDTARQMAKELGWQEPDAGKDIQS